MSLNYKLLQQKKKKDYEGQKMKVLDYNNPKLLETK